MVRIVETTGEFIALVEHMAGRHDQRSHGHRGPGVAVHGGGHMVIGEYKADGSQTFDVHIHDHVLKVVTQKQPPLNSIGGSHVVTAEGNRIGAIFENPPMGGRTKSEWSARTDERVSSHTTYKFDTKAEAVYGLVKVSSELKGWVGQAKMGVLDESERIEEFNPHHDETGRFAPKRTAGVFGGAQSPQDALDNLAAGKDASISAADLPEFMDLAAQRTDHPDITELNVNGTKNFGDDGLGIARADMPQLDARAPEYFADLKSRGIGVKTESVDPRTLQPTQKDVSATNSAKLLMGYRDGSLMDKVQKDPSWRSIVSKDGYVLDGHHRWAAGVAYAFESKGFKVPVTKVDLPMSQLLKDAESFTSKAGIAKKALGEAEFSGLVESIALLEFNPNHDARGRFASKHGGAGGGLAAAIERVEEDIRGIEGGEAAVFLDESGNVVLRKDSTGDPDGEFGPLLYGMTFSEAEVAQMRGHTAIHNHPETGNYGPYPASFSGSDMRMAQQASLKELRVIDHTGTRFVMKPGESGWGHGYQVGAAVMEAEKAAIKHFRPQMGRLTNQQANSLASDFISRRVADAMGWTYEVTRP